MPRKASTGGAGREIDGAMSNLVARGRTCAHTLLHNSANKGAGSITGDGARGRRHRLSIYEFSWRNRNLDLAAIDARNTDVMLHC